MCRDSGFEPSPLFEGKNIDSVADFAIKGMAIAIMTNGQTRFIRNPSVKVIDLVPTAPFDVYLCWKRGRQLSPAAMHFIRFAESHSQNGVVQKPHGFNRQEYPEKHE